ERRGGTPRARHRRGSQLLGGSRQGAPAPRDRGIPPTLAYTAWRYPMTDDFSIGPEDSREDASLYEALADLPPRVPSRDLAAEALGQIAHAQALGEAVRRALAVENSPFVQMALLDATRKLPASERVGAISPLLTREHIDPLILSDARARALAPDSQGEPVKE